MGFASSGDPAFAKLATQVSEYRNAEFVRDLNSQSLKMRLSGASDLDIQNFEQQAHLERVKRRTGIESLTPVPQTRFAGEQTFKQETKIREESSIRRDAARAQATAAAGAKADQTELDRINTIQQDLQDAVARGADLAKIRIELSKSNPDDIEQVMRPFYLEALRNVGDEPDKWQELLESFPEFGVDTKRLAPGGTFSASTGTSGAFD